MVFARLTQMTAAGPLLPRLAAIVTMALAVLGPAPAAGAEIERTHLLAIGICPPWKPQSPDICVRGVDSMVSALSARLNLTDADVTRVVNADATTAGLTQAFAGLSHLGPSDRLIIFANLHAGSLDINAPATAESDVFVLWTQEKPAVMAFAVAQGDWIHASDFAAMVHAVPAGEIIFILDACESGAVDPLFIEAHSGNDAARPEAVVTSARANQFSNFSADGSTALFTGILAEAIATAGPDLGAAVALAAERTPAAAVPVCKGLADVFEKMGVSQEACVQQPLAMDPAGLLSSVRFD